MPLEIAYRPFTLPTGALPPAAEENVRAGDVSRQRDDNPADGLADMADPAPLVPRPRDFAARIRRRDMVSVRRRLRTPSMLRQRLAGVATIGLFAMVLGPVGWGSPGGIDRASAQAEAGALQPFEQAGESFPGSAFYYVSPDDTGLIAPNAAEQAWAAHRDDEEVASAIEPAGPAARPIFARGSGEDQWRALQCLTAAIYYEAASEPDSGQRAVAQVVLNRVAHPAFPNTVCGVVYQGSERPGCQFSFACDGAMARTPSLTAWIRARRVAEAALSGQVYAPVGSATFYHTTTVAPGWRTRMVPMSVVGAHI
ncbi:cell wall hydrolase, partial [Novosphingobium sp. UBA1939]|uniref:cell wall hydrolase n=1 Tax=Novosphingobium sp. UBA1939 TaxID=1946982 RepID=UPI0025FA549F